jgi:hypothetical protein
MLQWVQRPTGPCLPFEESTVDVLACVAHLTAGRTRAADTAQRSLLPGHLPILWTTQSCWHRGQRLFCFTHRDMQQLWKEWLLFPDHNTILLLVFGLASKRGIHHLDPADGARIALHVPAPHNHRVPFLEWEHFVTSRFGACAPGVRGQGARLLAVFRVGHGSGAGPAAKTKKLNHLMWMSVSVLGKQTLFPVLTKANLRQKSIFIQIHIKYVCVGRHKIVDTMLCKFDKGLVHCPFRWKSYLCLIHIWSAEDRIIFKK